MLRNELNSIYGQSIWYDFICDRFSCFSFTKKIFKFLFKKKIVSVFSFKRVSLDSIVYRPAVHSILNWIYNQHIYLMTVNVGIERETVYSLYSMDGNETTVCESYVHSFMQYVWKLSQRPQFLLSFSVVCCLSFVVFFLFLSTFSHSCGRSYVHLIVE